MLQIRGASRSLVARRAISKRSVVLTVGVTLSWVLSDTAGARPPLPASPAALARRASQENVCPMPSAATPSLAAPGKRSAIGRITVLPAEPGPTGSPTNSSDQSEARTLRTVAWQRSLPPGFVENLGQVDGPARYYLGVPGQTLWLTGDGMVFDLLRALPADDAPGSDRAPTRGHPVQVERLAFAQDLVGARPGLVIEGRQPRPGTYNFFADADPARWRTGVRAYAEVVYRDVWEHIDLRLHASGRTLEQEFVVKPGGDPGRIRVAYRGIDTLQVAGDGTLLIRTAFGELRESPPRIYQEIGGRRVEVAGRFKLLGGTAYTFEVGPYQPQYALVIDPTLAYSTYLGGGQPKPISSEPFDEGRGIAVDAQGRAYVAGETRAMDFPLMVPFQGTVDPLKLSAAFVTKLDATGSNLVYSTYLGNGAWANAIAIDGAGAAYVTGKVEAGGSVPLTPGAAETVLGFLSNAFVTKLAPDGSALEYSTYSTFTASDEGRGIAVDLDGNAYIAGDGGGQAWARMLAPNGTSFLYSRLFGGSGLERGNGIAVDGDRNAYVAGSTSSADFPTTPGAFQQAGLGTAGVGAFVVKLDAVGTTVYATFLAGNRAEEANGIAVDASGHAHVTGYTASSNFPTTAGAFQTTREGGVDAFVAKVAPDGSSLVYASLLGGAVDVFGGGGTVTVGVGIALDAAGNAHVSGHTTAGDFPVTADAAQFRHHFSRFSDAFLTKFNATGSTLIYSTILGGQATDVALAVAVDVGGDSYITGRSDSTPPDFPVTASAFQPARAGHSDAFVAKFNSATPPGLFVTIVGPGLVSPGETVDYAVSYTNFLPTGAQDTVLLLILPGIAEFVSSTAGGIYRPDTHEVFWRLGTVAPGTSGIVSASVRLPFGLPSNFPFSQGAVISSGNIVPRLFDLDSYLAYERRRVTAEQNLTPTEISAELAADPPLTDLFNHALALGFRFYDHGKKITFSDTTTRLSLPMVNPSTVELLMATRDADVAYLERWGSGPTYSILDARGGLTLSLADGAIQSSGAWAEIGSHSEGQALAICLVRKVGPALLQRRIPGVAAASTVADCFTCAQTRGGDRSACAKCAAGILDPAVGEAVDVRDCVKCARAGRHGVDCAPCSKPKLFCPTGGILDTIARRQPIGANQIAYGKFECQDGLYSLNPTYPRCVWFGGQLAERFVCKEGYENPLYNNAPCFQIASCEGGSPGAATLGSIVGLESAHASSSGARALVTNPSEAVISAACSMSAAHESATVQAKDPNAKSGHKGDVVPGQTFEYVIDYENVGEGIAFAVFVTDTLPAALDAATLVIDNAGTYDAATRTVRWEIGRLDPHQRGAVRFRVNVRGDVPSGTEIINFATVFFPSVPEVTLTNPVVNVVRQIAAFAQSLETLEDTPITITLSGKDVANSALTFAIVEEPLNGSLSGAPPDIVYTPAEGFEGVDRFTFKVNNGLVDSERAAVTILVKTSPADTTPPTVVTTYPAGGAAGIWAQPTPVADGVYLPRVTATFSEAMDSTSITAATFSLNGVAGTVAYDGTTRTASFVPASPLAPGTTYTPTISGMRDTSGNLMTGTVTWSFTTAPLVGITIDPGLLSFALTNVGSTSAGQRVLVSKVGPHDLVLGPLAVTGSHPADFPIQLDKCSTQTLGPAAACAVEITFRPTGAGLRFASLSIPSNDPQHPTTTVVLSATGLATGRQLTALGPAKAWIGLASSDDVGIRFDLKAEVRLNGVLVGSGRLDGVTGGSSGFNNAKLHTIPLTLAGPVEAGPGESVSVTLYARNACTGSGKNSGRARLWYNDPPVSSRFNATIGGAEHNYYLRDGFALTTSHGQGPRRSIDVAAGARCSPFKTFGTWSLTLL